VRRLAFLLGALALAACQLLAGLEDRAPAEQPADAATDGADQAAEAMSCETCGTASCVDVATNPKHCGYCGHDCRGGVCSSSMCPAVTIPWDADGGLPSISSLTVDDTHLYFSTPTAIMRLPKNGGAIESVLSKSSVNALGIVDGIVYYTQLGSQLVVGAVQGDGGSASILTTLDASPGIAPMAVDSLGIVFASGIGIRSLLADGGSLATVLPESAAYETIVRVVVDATDVYFLHFPASGSPTTSTLERVSRAGADAGSLLWSDLGVAGTIALAGGNVFWSDRKKVYRLPTDGGSQWAILAQMEADALVTRGNEIYWLLIADPGRITVLPQTGGKPSPLAVGLSFSKTIAADDAWVYFDDKGDGGRVIRKVSR
jgi:hypothetical protein